MAVFTATGIMIVIEGLVSLANILAVEDREATPEELEASGLRTDTSITALRDLIAKKRAEQASE